MLKKERCLSQIFLLVFISIVLIPISSGFAFAQTVILNQAPDQVNGYVSDFDAPQSIADNFVVSSTANVTQIRIWGFYAYTGTAPATDNFTVIFHADSAGLPGTSISTQTNVPVIRQVTGGTVIGYTEYVYTLTLATPVNLSPGTYWVEIYDDTSADTDDNFYWELGTVDSTNGIPNSALATTTPGSGWITAQVDFAIEITKENVAVPTMNEWGMVLFILLAGTGAVYSLRRQKAKV